MAFKKWDDRRVPQKRSLRLNHANLNIGWTAYEEIGGPERVDVFYDKEAKAIQILPNKEGRKVSIKPSPHLSIKLAKEMPVGKYHLVNPEGTPTDGIFKLEESQ